MGTGKQRLTQGRRDEDREGSRDGYGEAVMGTEKQRWA